MQIHRTYLRWRMACLTPILLVATTTPSAEVAQSVEQRTENELPKLKLLTTSDQLLTKFLVSRRGGLSPRTIEFYKVTEKFLCSFRAKGGATRMGTGV